MLLNCGVGEDSCWVPWTARRSILSILKEISPEYSLEGLMLKLKLQLWPPDAKNWFFGKEPDTGKDWRQEEKGMTGWDGWRYHRLNGHEFEEAVGVGDGQGSLAFWSPWGHKELDTTEQLNWTIRVQNVEVYLEPHWHMITIFLEWEKLKPTSLTRFCTSFKSQSRAGSGNKAETATTDGPGPTETPSSKHFLLTDKCKTLC